MLEIDPDRAEVVRRIFRDYAAGVSPLKLARQLNAEGIPGPQRAWSDGGIRGHKTTRNGILDREIYIGQLIWNRTRHVKDPQTGQRVLRVNPPDAWVVRDLPDLRIIDQDVWDRVQQRRALERAPQRTNSSGRPQKAFWSRRRPIHLLTGKVFCGVCAGGIMAVGRDYLGCKKAQNHSCTNTARVRRPQLQAKVLQALGRELMQPEPLVEFISEFTAEWNRLARQSGADTEQQKRDLQSVERKLENLIEAITNGLKAPGLQLKLDQLEERQTALRQALAKAPPPPPALHPNIAEVYRRKVAALDQALAQENGPEALEAARALIDRVLVYPPACPPSLRALNLSAISPTCWLLVASRRPRRRRPPPSMPSLPRSRVR